MMCATKFTDECVHLFPYGHAEEVDHVYSTVCDEKEMGNKPRRESHGHAKLARNKFASSHTGNSVVYDTVNAGNLERSKLLSLVSKAKCN